MTSKGNLENSVKSNRILSLSGNGIEGVTELVILAEIEARTGKSVSELFPVITGSGIGGLIGTLLTVPKSQGSTVAKYSAKESLEIFKEISVSIFEYYKYRGMKQELKHRYRQKALKELLDKYIGNTHLGNVTSRLIMPTTNLNTNAKDVKISEGYNLVDSNSSNHSDLKLQDILLTTTAAPTHVNLAQYLASEALKKIQDKRYSNSKTENIENTYNVVVALNFDKETKTNKEVSHTINNIIIGEPNQQKLSDQKLNSQSTSAVELIENILNQGDTYSKIVLPVGNDTKQINNATNKNILALEEISHQYIIKHDKELTQLCQILLGDLPRSQQVTAALDTQERDEGYESDVDIALEKQVRQEINKQEVNNLAQPKEKVPPTENTIYKSQQDKSKEIFKGWEFAQGKTGGVNDAGKYGGVYKSTDGTKLAMIKKEQNPSNNISEYLGSKLFNAISKGNGAKVSIIVPKMLEKELGNGIRNHNLDQEVYVKSEFFNNYSGDMYVDMDRYMSESTKPSAWFRKDGGRPLFMGSRNKLHSTLENAFKELDYQGFEDIMPASLLIGDFDIHLGNIGIIRDNNKSKPQMVRIDFAASLQNLTDKIYPHSRLRHLPGFGPTNHYREFPSHLRRNNEALGIKLLEASKIDLSHEIDNSFEEMSRYYSKDAIISFAKAALPKQFDKSANTEISINEIKEAFKLMVSRRQESLKEYAMEVLLSTVVDKIAKAPYYEINNNKLKELITNNMEYFVDRFVGVDKVNVKVSDKSLRGVFLVKKGVEQMLGQEISSILKEVINDNKKSTLLLNQSKVNNNKVSIQKQDNINSMQAKLEYTTNSHNLLESHNQGQDVYIIKNNVVASTKSAKHEQVTLTTMVRNEILEKQRYQLSLYLSRYAELAQFVRDDKSFQDFLSNLNTENKKLVDKALTNTKLKAELEHIELSGYRKMQNAFKDLSQDITWGNTINSNIGLQRSQIIKDGEHEVCKLIETTNNTASMLLYKQDGTAVTLNKYRTISFPTRINHAINSMDLAIVALDEMGNRPNESHAVYFTAHYEVGADGKTILTEVSTPIPLKFQGDDKDAIGYVEHNGKVYTMPVTRGKYEEMMIEVARNKGQGLNLSQTIEQEAYSMAKVAASRRDNHSPELEDYNKEKLIHNSMPSLELKKKTDKAINIAQINDLPYKSTENIVKVIKQNLKKAKKYNKSINYYSKANNIKKNLNNNGRTR